MNTQPKVSIVIPVYNAEASLGRTLKSLESQEYGNLQIVLIDDGSTDSSSSMADSFASNCASPEVLVRHIDNCGAYKAREVGIDISDGDYVAFCDAGDVLESSFVTRMVEMATVSDADICVCAFLRTDGNTNKVEMKDFGSGCVSVDNECGWLSSVNTSLWNKLFKRQLLEKRILLNKTPRIGEDAMLLFSIYPSAKKIAFTDQVLYTYFVEDGSAMSTLSTAELSDIVECWVQVRNKTVSSQTGFERIIDLAAMVHLGVSAQLVIARTPNENPKKVEATISRELSSSFPLYRNSVFVTNEYVKKFPQMKKIAAMHFCVTHNLMALMARIYRFASERLNIKLGW